MADEQQVVDGAEPVGMDMDAALSDIAESLSLLPEEPPAASEGALPTKDEPAEPPVAGTTEPEKAAANPTGDAPPDTWRKEAKEAWATVPPAAREEMRKREADIAGYVERVKQPVAVGERFTEIVTPYLKMFEATNTDPWANVEAMFKVQERLLHGSPEEKLSIIGMLASQSGLKLENGQLSAAEGSTSQYVKALEQRLEKLEGGVNQVTSTVREARAAELQGNVVKFAQDKDAHPYFYDVADKITHLIRTGAVSNLEEAYQTAVMADPITRQKVVQAEAKQFADSEAKAVAERAAKARQTSKVTVRATVRGTAAQPPGSIDDTLKDTLAAIQSRTH